MAETPRFSITVPAYNAASTLAETVASVQAQRFDDWEIVICDDGSADGTLALAESLSSADGRIRVVSQENRGSGGAYNTAVSAARARLIVMLSADDLLLPGHLEAYDRAIREHPDAAIFSSDAYYEYEDGIREPAHANEGWADPGSCAMTDLLRACILGVGAVYRREVFDTVGGFREDMYAEDYPFWLLAFAHGYRHRFVDEVLAVHRRNRQQKSASAVRVRRAEAEAITLVLGTGLLSPAERRVARAAARSARAKVLVWQVLLSLLGERRAAILVDRVRGRARSHAG